jgi:biotin carboxyl carrier protein
MSNLDSELVRHALDVARKHGFAEVEVGIGEASFTAKFEPGARKSRANGSSAGPETTAPETQTIAATLVGYYRESKHPLRVGSILKKGDVVAIITALGIANDVESKYAGEVVEVLVEPNQPVEFGQALAKVKI